MRVRILKKESSLKALPLVMMLIGLVVNLQNSRAMDTKEPDPLINGSSKEVKKSENNTLSALVSDDVDFPEIPPGLLQLIPINGCGGPKENWDKVYKALRFFNDPQFYKNLERREEKPLKEWENQIKEWENQIKECEETTKGRVNEKIRELERKIEELENNKPGGLKAYQTTLVTEAWKAREAVAIYLGTLYQKTEALISKIQEYQQLACNLKEGLGELRGQNQALMEKNATLKGEIEGLSKNKEESSEKNNGLIRDLEEINESIEKNKQQKLELEKELAVLKNETESLLKNKEEFIGKNTSAIEDTEETNGSIKQKGQQAPILEEEFAVFKNNIEGALKEKEELSAAKEELFEKNKELIKVLEDIEKIKEFVEKGRQKKLNLEEEFTILKHEVDELSVQKEDLLREKEELTSGNGTLDLEIEKVAHRENLKRLVQQFEDINTREEQLNQEPRVIEQVNVLKLENERLLKDNELISRGYDRVKALEKERADANKKLVETNQHLSNMVSFLAWGGVACAAITVSYIVLQRSK